MQIHRSEIHMTFSFDVSNWRTVLRLLLFLYIKKNLFIDILRINIIIPWKLNDFISHKECFDLLVLVK